MTRAPRVIAPSDLSGVIGPRPARGELRVGGRVLSAQGRTLVIADAFATLEAELARRAHVEAGDLVVLRGRRRGRRLRAARVEERHACPAPRGDGEHARLCFDGVGPELVARARALAEIRRYFGEQGFVEVETPLRVRTPGLDLHVDAIAAEGGFLVTSPEHHMKRLLVGGTPRIFQLCRASRAGERGALHEPEFTMLEWYRAFSTMDAVMEDTEAVVRRVTVAVSGRDEVLLPNGRRIALGRRFERVTVREAFARWANVGDATRLSEDRFFELLVSKVEPALAAAARPVFLTEYPVAQASLARKSPRDPRVAERFELYLGGVELCNGFGELTDAREQRRRFERDRATRRRLRRPVYDLDEKLLAALVEGMPPAGGNALGVDRLIALARGRSAIESVMAFPASRI